MKLEAVRHRAIAGVISLTVGAMLVMGATPAEAAPAPATIASSSVSAPPALTAAQIKGKIVAAQATLLSSEVKSVLTMGGYDLSAVKDASGRAFVRATALPVSHLNSLTAASGVCTNLVAAGVVALGAIALGVAAASGGLEIAGAFIAPEVLNLLAAAGNTYATVQGIIALYVC
jgi:hypothetical protein